MEGNLTNNPLFIDVENEDYNLQTVSPCIDAGIADLDNDGIDDVTNYTGIAPDMGAIEWASTYLGDINQDGLINISDIVILVAFLLDSYSFTPEQEILANINGDEDVNVVDIVIIVQIILES
jgi:hypothetical protein